jgi:hypothetical protein
MARTLRRAPRPSRPPDTPRIDAPRAPHLSRAEDRVLTLVSDLAERFGRVTPDGIVIDIDLTHDLIGQMIASRRQPSRSRSPKPPNPTAANGT